MKQEIVKLMNEEIDVFSTIDTSTSAGRKLSLVCINNSPTKRVSDYIGKQITFDAVVMTKVKLEDDKKVGKEVEAIQTVLHTPDGETVACTSQGFAESICMILSCLGYPDTWEEEYWFEVKQIETRKGRRLFKLEFID